jgi:crotonobetainyl-CoA:carnitine CoA-transferase CaiB-like acyl-CoA transferase
MHLADHGAEVIKIEDGRGDTSRGNGPFRDDDPTQDWAGYFVSLNRGKKNRQKAIQIFVNLRCMQT